MEQSKTTAAASVVRQLDFLVNTYVKANAGGNLILPEHPQAQLQSKLLGLPQLQKLNGRGGSTSPSMVAQIRLRPNKMVVPLESPPPLAPRLAHRVRPQPALQPFLKTESPKSRERRNLEHKDGTPKKQKQCNCKNTRCLKLYCECFASGILCDGCNCINCHNKIEHESDRKVAIDTVLERNPDAFRPKIANSPGGAIDGGVEHNKGCNCKKSGCLKRYCECFQANILCSDKCKCLDCKNFEGSEKRNALFHDHRTNSMAFMNQVANAAINGAIGTVLKQSKNPHSFSRVTSNKQATSWHGQQRQEVRLTFEAPYSPTSVHQSRPARATELGPSKSSYRSPLNRILQSQDVKDLCTHLVEVSAEAAKTLSEKINDTGVNKATISAASLCDDSKSKQNHVAIELCENQESIKSSFQNGRPLSPGTLALMCDEQCAIFTTADSTSTVTESDTSIESRSGHGLEKLNIEQERLVLTNFCSFLNKLIKRGGVEGDDDDMSSYS